MRTPTRRRTIRLAAGCAVLLISAAISWQAARSAESDIAASVGAAVNASGSSSALDLLATIPVARDHTSSPRYDRETWNHWIDADSNGCDTRREVLIAESTRPVALDSGCFIAGGQWLSAYDGVTLDDPSELDIDHLVPLAEAHRSGGWAWDNARKEAYANDLSDSRPLIAVTAATNRAKSDKDPAAWMPEQNQCDYVGAWIATKAHWQLTMNAEEATVLSDLLLGPCAGLTIPEWGTAT